jgi:sugar-specific transcriptional regulator TrmB
MHDAYRAKLESFGLSSGEAQIYLVLLRSGGTLGASALARATRIPRTGVYPLLNSLIHKGIVEAEAGYGSRFTAIPPTHALPSLIARERDEHLEKLSQRERLAGDLIGELESIIEPTADNAEAEVIQVLRDPRAVAQRFERLELEAQREVDVFVKAPIFISAEGNPAQQKAQRRGVRFRGVYERAAIETPQNKPSLAKWIAAGEEARIYDGELPHKLAIFDSEIVLMPLIRPHQPTKTVMIRHPQLAQSLTIVFEHFWQRSEPISTLGKVSKTQTAKSRADHRIGRNGRRDHVPKK